MLGVLQMMGIGVAQAFAWSAFVLGKAAGSARGARGAEVWEGWTVVWVVLMILIVLGVFLWRMWLEKHE